jgi:poly(3-hydroxybutyrate) depolymerase
MDRSREDQGCRLHIALHGCRQTAETVGDAFTRHAGCNGWAEANRIVVLYPASHPVRRPPGGVRAGPNPQGCGDWWGFTGPDFAVRRGAQISAILAMVDRLAEGR